MIEAIHGRDFKGQSFDQALGSKNLIIGPNRSGKSARAQALFLCLLGYVPCADKPKKQNAEIMQAFATKDVMIVGVTFKGHKYERRFFRSPKTGAVSQKFRIDGGSWTVPKSQFDGAIYTIPKPLDLSVFMSLSDPKKIDHLFKMYPPKSELAGLDANIEKLEEDLKAKQAELTKIKDLCVSIENNIAGIQLPPGNLEDVLLDIERTRSEYKLTRDNIVRAKTEAEAEEKAKKLAAEQKAAADKKAAYDKAERLAKEAADKGSGEDLPPIVESSMIPVGPENAGEFKIPKSQQAAARKKLDQMTGGFKKMPPSGPPPGADVGIVKREPEKSEFAPLAAAMNPMAAKIANELAGKARFAISDMIAIAEKVSAHAVVMKGNVHLKAFEAVVEPEQY